MRRADWFELFGLIVAMAGFSFVVAGVALFSVPIALIVAGGGMMASGFAIYSVAIRADTE